MIGSNLLTKMYQYYHREVNMKTIFAATVLTATLGLSACDAAPEAALIEPPLVIATAAAEEETPEALLARLEQKRQQLCASILISAQATYQARRLGVPRQVALDGIGPDQEVGPAAKPLRDLVLIIYGVPPAQFESPAMAEVLPGLATLTCQNVVAALIANHLDRP